MRFFFIHSIAFILVVVALASSSLAEMCSAKSFSDFAFVSSESAEVRNSDFQGSSVIGGAFIGRKFKFEYERGCPSISAVDSVDLQRVKVLGGIEAGGKVLVIGANLRDFVSSKVTMELQQLYIGGPLTAPVIAISEANPAIQRLEVPTFQINHQNLIEGMKNKSREWSTLTPNTSVNKGKVLSLDLGGDRNVVSLKGSDFSTGRVVEIRGNSDQFLLVNISGSNVSLKDTEIRAISKSGKDAIPPSHIVWNFYQAKQLYILLHSPERPHPGWLGSILAPLAVTEAYDSRVTGGLYVKGLMYSDTTKSTIQINRPRYHDLN